MTMKDTAKGTGRMAKGRMKEMAGRATNDPALQSKGLGDQLAGRTRRAMGRMKGSLRGMKHH